VASLRPESPFLGQTLADAAVYLTMGDTSILSILRGEHMLAPRPDLIAERGDRFILVAGTNSAAALEPHFTLW